MLNLTHWVRIPVEEKFAQIMHLSQQSTLKSAIVHSVIFWYCRWITADATVIASSYIVRCSSLERTKNDMKNKLPVFFLIRCVVDSAATVSVKSPPVNEITRHSIPSAPAITRWEKVQEQIMGGVKICHTCGIHMYFAMFLISGFSCTTLNVTLQNYVQIYTWNAHTCRLQDQAKYS